MSLQEVSEEGTKIGPVRRRALAAAEKARSKTWTGATIFGYGVIFLILIGLSGYMWWRAQQQKVDSSNVNADWDSSTNSVVPADVREAAAAAEAATTVTTSV